MLIYGVKTIYPGADKPTCYYYSTKDKALKRLKTENNGEIEVIELKINSFPYEGCTWSEIKYWQY